MSTQKEILDLILNEDLVGLQAHLEVEGTCVLTPMLRSLLNTINARAGTPATLKYVTFEQELVMLKIRDVLADKLMCSTSMAADVAKYGEPQCDYPSWQQELAEKMSVLFKEAEELKAIKPS